MRLEQDLLGEKNIADDCYYGINTIRACENFDLSRIPIHPKLIVALATVKFCCAEANSELGLLDKTKAQAISQAAREIIQGELQNQFPVDALQGGAGTSTNLNMNEVLANRALEILGYAKGRYDVIHPINDVNLHQSTNDVYPTALKIAAIWLLKELSNCCSQLQEALQAKEQAFSDVLKIGRTELQDAVPIMLGQEFGAYAQAIARDRWRIYKVEERLRQFSGVPIRVKRLALNMDQVIALHPPENPAKVTDTRFKDYALQYGESSWELDAVEPGALANLVITAVEERRDPDLWSAALQVEEAMRGELQRFADSYRPAA